MIIRRAVLAFQRGDKRAFAYFERNVGHRRYVAEHIGVGCVRQRTIALASLNAAAHFFALGSFPGRGEYLALCLAFTLYLHGAGERETQSAQTGHPGNRLDDSGPGM